MPAFTATVPDDGDAAGLAAGADGAGSLVAGDCGEALPASGAALGADAGVAGAVAGAEAGVAGAGAEDVGASAGDATTGADGTTATCVPPKRNALGHEPYSCDVTPLRAPPANVAWGPAASTVTAPPVVVVIRPECTAAVQMDESSVYRSAP